MRKPRRLVLPSLSALLLVICLLPAFGQREPQAEELFNQANDLYTNGFFDLAVGKFLEFVQAYPQHANASLALYLAGECSFQQDQYADALPVFQRVLDEYPQSEDVEYALYRIGFCNHKLEDFSGARQAFDRLLREHPQTEQKPAALYWTAESCFREGSYEEAITAYRGSIEADPKGQFAAWALYSIGFIQLEHLNQPQQALTTLQKVMDDYPNSPAAEPARKKIADAQVATGNVEGARQQYQAMAQSDDEAVRQQGLLGLARSSFVSRDWAEAEAAYRRFLEAFPQSPSAALAELRIAHCLYEQGKYDAAAARYEAAAARGGEGVAEALRWQGACLEKSGDKEKAKAAYQRVVTEFPNDPLAPGAAQALGALLLADGDLDGAEEAYRLAAGSNDAYYRQWAAYGLAWIEHRRDPTNTAGADALAALAVQAADEEVGLAAALDAGRLYVDAQAYAKAVPLLQGFLAKVEEGERAALAHFALARAHQGQGQSAQAITAYEQGIAAGLPAELEAAALAALVDLYRAAGDDARADEAVARLQREHSDSPAAAVAAYDRAEALFRAGRYDEARPVYQSIIDNTPQSPLVANALCGLGSCALAQGDFTTAADLYQQVIQKHPDTEAAVFAEYNRAVALVRSGNAAEAAAALEAFVQQHPDSPWATEARRELAWSYIVAKQDDRAKPLLEAMAADAQAPAARRAWALFHLGEIAYRAEDYAAAQARYEEVGAQYPDSDIVDEAHYKRGWALLKQDRKDEATAAFEACLAGHPEVEVRADCLRVIGDALYQKGNHTEAIQRLQPFLDELQNTTCAPHALLVLGLAATQLQDWATAHKAFNKIEAGDDKVLGAQVELGLGRALLRQGESEEAAPHLEAAVGMAEGITKVYAMFERAMLKAVRGEDKAAGEEFLIVAARLPAQDALAPQALYLAGEALERAGDTNNARKAFESLVEKFAEDNEWVQKAKAKLATP